MRRIWILTAGLNGLAAVVAGALAQHLWADDPHRLHWVETGVRYGLPHAAALLALAAAPQSARSLQQTLVGWGACSLALGTTLFSLSLYGLAVGAPPLFGWATPAGGALMIVGWCLVIAYALALVHAR